MTLVVAALMALVVATPAFAQTVGTAAEGKGSITINNAAKGETYSVVKIFGATLAADKNNDGVADGIAYTGDIPDALKDYFEKDTTTGNILRKASATDDAALTAAVQAYAKTLGATASAKSDGSALVFQGLDYGYYAVISTQGAVVTVDSVNPNVTVNDKNSKTVTADKTVENDSYTIGDTIKYTAKFDTVNWMGADTAAKQVTKYEISDTLPEFLSDVSVKSIKVDADGNLETTDDQTALTTQQFTDKKITIPWVAEDVPTTDHKYTSLYNNGAKLIVEYEAKLTGTSNVNTANTNTVSILPYTDDGTGEKPWNEPFSDDAVVTTYGTALKKIDGQTQEALKGAKFQVPGLTVAAVAGEPGVYKVVSYDATSTTAGTEMTTNDEGKLYIIGINEDVTLSATETAAPEGYNKANAPISLPAQKLTETLYETSGDRYYDAKGNLVSESSSTTTTETVNKNYTMLDENAVPVVNNKGTELPSTGGMGTTILYVVGGVMVAGAAVYLLTKKRASSMQ